MRQIKVMLSVLIVSALSVTPSALAGQAQNDSQGQRDNTSEKDDGEGDGNGSSLEKLGFGIGLGFRWNLVGGDLITEAEVDSAGIVRAKKRANTHTGFNFETHYLIRRNKAGSFGVGPFVAAEAGSDALITSVGLGVLVAWKVNNQGRGFGLGIGYSAQPSIKVVGDEFVAGKPAPTGPDGKPLPIRHQEKDEGSLLVILSVVF
jgi:hypothetical protein